MNRIKDTQPTPYLGNKTINIVTPLLTRQRMQVEFLFIFLEYCFELCDRLFPKYDPMCFIEVCVHLYLSSRPSCVLSSISLTSTQVSVRSHVMDLQPIRGQTGSCLQLLNISQYLAFVTLLHRKS